MLSLRWNILRALSPGMREATARARTETERWRPPLSRLILVVAGAAACIPDVGPVKPAQCETIGETRCLDSQLSTCNADWQWQINGTCVVPPPRCAELPPSCGPNGDEDCCASRLVPMGEYNRYNDPAHHVTLTSDFMLDRFEVTVGRFRKFVEAYTGPPDEGAGKHPRIPGRGWDPAWNNDTPADADALKEAFLDCRMSDFPLWTESPGENENKPINCVRWTVAFAFCAWDGGRLPTEAEWAYAVGGVTQHVYPWGDEAMAPEGRAVFGCTADGSPVGDCSSSDIPRVGSVSPLGDGEWGHADLAGSMDEWTLDILGAIPDNCVDCANVDGMAPIYRVRLSGHWRTEAGDLTLVPEHRIGVYQGYDIEDKGIRCVRDP